MSSAGLETAISISEAADLLHKLRTESAIVQVLFQSRAGQAVGIVGLILPGPLGWVAVKPSEDVEYPFFLFNPNSASSIKYASNYALPASIPPSRPGLLSSLIFVYPDQSQVTIYEIDAETIKAVSEFL